MESINNLTETISELEENLVQLKEKTIFELPRNLQIATIKKENKLKCEQTIQNLILYLQSLSQDDISTNQTELILDLVNQFSKNNFGL